MPVIYPDKICIHCGKSFNKRPKEMPVRYFGRKLCSKECLIPYMKSKCYNDAGEKKCSKCGIYKPVSEYHLQRKGGYLHAVCKPCILAIRAAWDSGYKEHRRNMANEKRKTLKYKFSYLVQTAKLRHKKDQFDIDVNFINHLWNIQGGKCYYSGINMTNITGYGRGTNAAIRFNVSIDRVDSDKGYTKDNIVLCCDIINRMKLNMNINDFENIISIIYNYNKSKKEVSLAKVI